MNKTDGSISDTKLSIDEHQDNLPKFELDESMGEVFLEDGEEPDHEIMIDFPAENKSIDNNKESIEKLSKSPNASVSSNNATNSSKETSPMAIIPESSPDKPTPPIQTRISKIPKKSLSTVQINPLLDKKLKKRNTSLPVINKPEQKSSATKIPKAAPRKSLTPKSDDIVIVSWK